MIKATLNAASPRAREWDRVFATRTVPLESPYPVTNDSPAGVRVFYRVAVAQLTPAQRERLIEHLAVKYNEAPSLVAATLDDPEHGLPILAEDVNVSIDLRAFI